jgi:large subunit ribosomal protein L10
MSVREKVLQKKQDKVQLLTEEFGKSDALFFTEYRGLTVSQLRALRHDLRQAKASYYVVKNSLIQRTFNDLNIEFPQSLLKGPTALVVSKQDCPQIAAIVYAFKKGNDALVVKGGYLDNGFLSEGDVKALSKLPSRDVLIGQLVGGLKSTISRFVMSMSSPMRGLVYSLEAIKNKKN